MHCIIYTAGAGTGKTTTLLQLAKANIDNGHRKIQFATFSKSQTEDAAKRFTESNLISYVSVKTLHSIAYSCLSLDEVKTEDDMYIEKLISKECESEISRLVSAVPIKKRKTAIKTITTFIRKTLEAFMNSARSEEDGFDRYHTYYPAKLWHTGNDKPLGISQYYGSFYVDNARAIWDKMRYSDDSNQPPEFFTHSSYVKIAQLRESKIDATVILVDESQDLNECQIAWMATQALRYNTQLYFVGDLAQTIYSFRGAKSKFIAQLEGYVRRPGGGTIPIIDRSLTTSWRFGPTLAAIGNTVLFCKEFSPQTTGERGSKKDVVKTWYPYRLRGGKLGCDGEDEGRITTQNLLSSETSGEWEGPVTVLAYSNMELFKVALGYITARKEGEEMKRFAVLGGKLSVV